MQIIFFSTNINIIDEWKQKYEISSSVTCDDLDALADIREELSNSILVVDYDSVSHGINSLISSNTLPKKVIVLECSPEITTGKMLIKNGVKAYGNSRMLINHFTQMLQSVENNNTWTYPKLTAALIQTTKAISLNDDAIELIEKRLTPQEIKVVYLVLQGLTNNAIATNLEITTRTVKAHVGSIFSKLHINDRISLVLLLK